MAPYRNSRTGNARRAVSQPDHDVFEGLPVRRWRKKAVNISNAAYEKPDPNAPVILHNGYNELPMPRDSNMLTETCQAILRGARAGLTKKDRTDDRDEWRETGEDKSTQTGEKPRLLTRKWALLPKDLPEDDEPEYLAKRRKGLPSLYGGDPTPINTAMRKTKIRKTDSEGNSQVFEVLVPEGQSVPGEIMEDELISPTQAPAPGTVVEGVGVTNAEGVVVAGDPVAAPPQRKRPPPPKRRLKGPGRGRKKKVQFVAGTDASVEPNGARGTQGELLGLSAGGGLDDAQNPAAENEDSIMQDAGQDGEEGSEDGSEGEEGEDGEREDGEVSATPEASSDPSKTQPLATEEPRGEEPAEDKTLALSPPSATKEKTFEEVMLEQQQDAGGAFRNGDPSLRGREAVSDQMDESSDGPSIEAELGSVAELVPQNDIDSTLHSNVPESAPHTISPSLPSPTKEPIEEPTEPPAPPAEAMEASRSSDLPLQDSLEASEEKPAPASSTQQSPGSASLPPKPPPFLSPESQPLQDPIAPSALETSAQAQGVQDNALTEPLPDEAALSSLPEEENQPSFLPPPPFAYQPTMPESIVIPSAEPVSDSKAPFPATLLASEPISDISPSAPTPVSQQEQHQMPYSARILTPSESRSAPVDHHTPKAPTPSPPTPIATSFDLHQRERLMQSPRAPTMSPPTPARDRSSSPDLPLASHDNPPPLTLDHAPGRPQVTSIPGLGRQPTPVEGGIDVEAAPNAPENFAAEIPHEHDPLDGLAPPKVPDGEQKEGEEPARFSDGEEDLLGSLERSLGKGGR